MRISKKKNFVEYHHYGPETTNIFIELKMLFGSAITNI